MVRLLLALSFLMILPLQAMASGTNEKDADTLKKIFQALMDYQKSVNDIMGNVNITYDGAVSVAPNNDYYMISLPDISITGKGKDKGTLHLGVITVDAMPDEKAGYWKTIINLPSELTFSDTDQTDNLKIILGKQFTKALLSEKLGYFTKFEMNLSEISIEAKEKAPIDLGDIQLTFNFDEKTEGKFSGLGHISFKDSKFSEATKDGFLNFGLLKLAFSMENAELPTLKDYQAKFEKHAEVFKSLNTIESSGTDALDSKAVMDMITDFYTFSVDSFGFEYSINDFKLHNAQKEPKDIALKSGSLGMNINGLGTEKGALNLKFNYDGLEASPAEGYYGDLTPDNANLDINIENIPYTSLSEVIKTSSDSIATNPNSAQMVGLSLMMRLPAILSQAGTQINIEKNGIKNEIYDVTLDGNIMTDLTSAMGFAANFKAMFVGLDEIITVVQGYGEEAQLSALSKNLNLLKTIGKNEASVNGKSAYSFTFETTPAGQFLVNGQDSSTLPIE